MKDVKVLKRSYMESTGKLRLPLEAQDWKKTTDVDFFSSCDSFDGGSTQSMWCGYPYLVKVIPSESVT